jgi:hypothetical protein
VNLSKRNVWVPVLEIRVYDSNLEITTVAVVLILWVALTLVFCDGCAEMIKPIPDMDEPAGQEGAELSKTPVDLKSGDWMLKVVPWIGGRIISMTHLPSGMLHLWLKYSKLLLCSHCTMVHKR